MNKDKDITPYNDKWERHGYWEFYRQGGGLIYKCIYNNGKRIGYEEYYGHPYGYKPNGTLIKQYYL